MAGKVIGVQQFYSKKIKVYEFDGVWEDFCGHPEQSATIFIYGNSANGKTSFAVQFAKYLSTFERVAYNSLEEGLSRSLMLAFQLAEIGKNDNIIVIDKMPIVELRAYLKKPKSPKIVFIDSFQYMNLNAIAFKKLVDEFRNKMFVIISHAEGKQPAGRSAKTVHYDADIKIWIEGFKAFPKSRYGGGEPYVIWADKAEQIWLTT